MNLEKENLIHAIRTWEYCAISLVDIRYQSLDIDNSIKKYHLPVSAFLFTNGGKAEVFLDDNSYVVERFGVFHGGKGCELSILPMGKLEYYLVLYKAGEPPFHKKEFLRSLEKNNPFRQQYGFSPKNPIFFLEQLTKMYERFKEPIPLHLFYGKASFYQLVYQIYEELYHENIDVFQPDVVAMAKRHIKEHYHEMISLQDMSTLLGVSSGHLRSSFKSRYGCSPQKYLTDLRIASAKSYILHSDFTLKEIAESTGFYDEYYMSRLFKKYEGTSPLGYKAKYTSNLYDMSIGSSSFFSYNEDNLVSLDKLKEEGVFTMLKQIRNKTIVGALLAVMLLSACSNTSSTLTKGGQEQTMVESKTEVTAVDQETKTVSSVRGEVEIPTSPKRVVVLNYGFGDILALGVTPIAVNDYWALAGSPVEDLLKDVQRVTDVEAIMDINPDLIITTYEDDLEYAKLSKIAPTISLGSVADTIEQTPEERLTYFGEILGVDDNKVQDVLESYNNHISLAKERLQEGGLGDKSVTLLTGSMEELSVVASTYKGAHALYNDLGMKRSEKVEELFQSGEWYSYISLEVLPDYCGDYIIIFGENNPFIGNGVYENIESVKNKNVILADEYLMTFNDVISVQAQVDFLVDSLLDLNK